MNDIRRHIDLIESLELAERAGGRRWSALPDWDKVPAAVRRRLEGNFTLDEFCDRLTNGNGAAMEVRVLPRRNMISFYQSDSGEAGVFRRFDYGRNVMEMQDMNVNPRHRRTGLGAWLLSNTAHACRAVGIDRLEVTAADDGLLVWLKAGYYMAPDCIDRLMDILHRSAGASGNAFFEPDGNESGEVIFDGFGDDLLEILDAAKTDPAQIWKLAENDIGANLLAFQGNWNGYFDLNDPVQLDRLEEFTERNRQMKLKMPLTSYRNRGE